MIKVRIFPTNLILWVSDLPQTSVESPSHELVNLRHAVSNGLNSDLPNGRQRWNNLQITSSLSSPHPSLHFAWENLWNWTCRDCKVLHTKNVGGIFLSLHPAANLTPSMAPKSKPKEGMITLCALGGCFGPRKDNFQVLKMLLNVLNYNVLKSKSNLS